MNVFKQPTPFYLIFLLEVWERFGFYGVQSILAIYFATKLGYPESQASIIFGSFSALTYALVSIGGKVGDSYLGTKRTMVLGAITLMLGYFLLSLSDTMHSLFFLGLGFIAAGNGLFKANPSSLLARCYKPEDPKLDSAFTMYYMAINFGALFSVVLVPYLAHNYDWSIGFYVCTIGLVFALLTYIFMKNSVAHIDSKAGLAPLKINRLIITIIGTIVAILFCTWLLNNIKITQMLLYLIGGIILCTYLYEILKLKGKQRFKMIVSLVLIIEAIAFFTLYMQMPTSLNFFALHNVEHQIFGLHVEPESFQSLNSIWIIIASPILAYIYTHLGKKKRDPSMPVKFCIGMFLCSFSFLILPLGIKTANSLGVINSYWLVLSYLLQSVGELLVSGLGLSMIAKLVPDRLRGFLMGAWFLSTSVASVIGGHIAGLSGAPASSTGVISPLETLPIFSHFFLQIGLWSFAIALILLITSPFLSRLIAD